MKFQIAIAIWLGIFAVLLLFIRGAGHQKRVERRQYRAAPTSHDLSASHDLLMVVQIGCAAGGVVLLVLIFVFGDRILNLVCGG